MHSFFTEFSIYWEKSLTFASKLSVHWQTVTTMAIAVNAEKRGSQKILKYTQIFLLLLEGEGEVTQSLPSSGEEKAEFGTSLVRTSYLCRHF